jgi:hypothetical protein
MKIGNSFIKRWVDGQKYVVTATYFKDVPIYQEFFYFGRRWSKTNEHEATWIAEKKEYYLADDTKVAAIERSAI